MRPAAKAKGLFLCPKMNEISLDKFITGTPVLDTGKGHIFLTQIAAQNSTGESVPL